MAQRPAAWLYTMHMELGQKQKRVELERGNPWGIPGRDYSKEYRVTEEPLFKASRRKKMVGDTGIEPVTSPV